MTLYESSGISARYKYLFVHEVLSTDIDGQSVGIRIYCTSTVMASKRGADMKDLKSKRDSQNTKDGTSTNDKNSSGAYANNVMDKTTRKEAPVIKGQPSDDGRHTLINRDTSKQSGEESNREVVQRRAHSLEIKDAMRLSREITRRRESLPVLNNRHIRERVFYEHMVEEDRAWIHQNSRWKMDEKGTNECNYLRQENKEGQSRRERIMEGSQIPGLSQNVLTSRNRTGEDSQYVPERRTRTEKSSTPEDGSARSDRLQECSPKPKSYRHEPVRRDIIKEDSLRQIPSQDESTSQDRTKDDPLRQSTSQDESARKDRKKEDTPRQIISQAKSERRDRSKDDSPRRNTSHVGSARTGRTKEDSPRRNISQDESMNREKPEEDPPRQIPTNDGLMQKEKYHQSNEDRWEKGIPERGRMISKSYIQETQGRYSHRRQEKAPNTYREKDFSTGQDIYGADSLRIVGQGRDYIRIEKEERYSDRMESQEGELPKQKRHFARVRNERTSMNEDRQMDSQNKVEPDANTPKREYREIYVQRIKNQERGAREEKDVSGMRHEIILVEEGGQKCLVRGERHPPWEEHSGRNFPKKDKNEQDIQRQDMHDSPSPRRTKGDPLRSNMDDETLEQRNRQGLILIQHDITRAMNEQMTRDDIINANRMNDLYSNQNMDGLFIKPLPEFTNRALKEKENIQHAQVHGQCNVPLKTRSYSIHEQNIINRLDEKTKLETYKLRKAVSEENNTGNVIGHSYYRQNATRINAIQERQARRDAFNEERLTIQKYGNTFLIEQKPDIEPPTDIPERPEDPGSQRHSHHTSDEGYVTSEFQDIITKESSSKKLTDDHVNPKQMQKDISGGHIEVRSKVQVEQGYVRDLYEQRMKKLSLAGGSDLPTVHRSKPKEERVGMQTRRSSDIPRSYSGKNVSNKMKEQTDIIKCYGKPRSWQDDSQCTGTQPKDQTQVRSQSGDQATSPDRRQQKKNTPQMESRNVTNKSQDSSTMTEIRDQQQQQHQHRQKELQWQQHQEQNLEQQFQQHQQQLQQKRRQDQQQQQYKQGYSDVVDILQMSDVKNSQPVKPTRDSLQDSNGNQPKELHQDCARTQSRSQQVDKPSIEQIYTPDIDVHEIITRSNAIRKMKLLPKLLMFSKSKSSSRRPGIAVQNTQDLPKETFLLKSDSKGRDKTEDVDQNEEYERGKGYKDKPGFQSDEESQQREPSGDNIEVMQNEDYQTKDKLTDKYQRREQSRNNQEHGHSKEYNKRYKHASIIINAFNVPPGKNKTEVQPNGEQTQIEPSKDKLEFKENEDYHREQSRYAPKIQEAETYHKIEQSSDKSQIKENKVECNNEYQRKDKSKHTTGDGQNIEYQQKYMQAKPAINAFNVPSNKDQIEDQTSKEHPRREKSRDKHNEEYQNQEWSKDTIEVQQNKEYEKMEQSRDNMKNRKSEEYRNRYRQAAVAINAFNVPHKVTIGVQQNDEYTRNEQLRDSNEDGQSKECKKRYKHATIAINPFNVPLSKDDTEVHPKEEYHRRERSRDRNEVQQSEQYQKHEGSTMQYKKQNDKYTIREQSMVNIEEGQRIDYKQKYRHASKGINAFNISPGKNKSELQLNEEYQQRGQSMDKTDMQQHEEYQKRERSTDIMEEEHSKEYVKKYKHVSQTINTCKAFAGNLAMNRHSQERQELVVKYAGHNTSIVYPGKYKDTTETATIEGRMELDERNARHYQKAESMLRDIEYKQQQSIDALDDETSSKGREHTKYARRNSIELKVKILANTESSNVKDTTYMTDKTSLSEKREQEGKQSGQIGKGLKEITTTESKEERRRERKKRQNTTISEDEPETKTNRDKSKNTARESKKSKGIKVDKENTQTSTEKGEQDESRLKDTSNSSSSKEMKAKAQSETDGKKLSEDAKTDSNINDENQEDVKENRSKCKLKVGQDIEHGKSKRKSMVGKDIELSKKPGTAKRIKKPVKLEWVRLCLKW